MKYSIGDQVVYPGHGACVVGGIEEKTMAGFVGMFYVFHPTMEDKTTFFIPVDKADVIGIRPIVSEAEARSIIDYTNCCDDYWIKDSKERAQTYKEIIKKGDLKEISMICKSLKLRERSGKLSSLDKDLLHALQKRFLSEIALALNESYDSALTQFNESIADIFAQQAEAVCE